MASNVASASCNRVRILSAVLRRFPEPLAFTTSVCASSWLGGARRAQVQPHQRALGVGEIAHQLANRFGELTHQGGHGQNLISPRQLRMLEEIDHLDSVSPLQMLLTDALEICQS